jgi:hypothetical protein
LPTGESDLVTVLIFYIHGGRCLAILQTFLDGLVGELPFLEVLEHSPTMDQVVGHAFICGIEVVQGKRNLQRAWNGGHSYDKQWSTLTYHTRTRTYHVGDANTALGSVHDVLKDVAKLVGLLLDEGPSFEWTVGHSRYGS